MKGYRMVALSLLLTALVTGGAFAAGAAGTTTTTTTTDSTVTAVGESPMLAALVAAGELPPVSERLADEPLVIEPLHEVGVYGGTLNLTRFGADLRKPKTMSGESLVSFDRETGGNAVPNIAKETATNSNFTEFTFTLRRGLKWSDGEPFTTEDVQWYWDNIILSSDLTPTPPAPFVADGQLMSFHRIDELTFRFTLNEPSPFFMQNEAIAGLAGTAFTQHAPQYLEQFHPDHTSQADLDSRVRAAGMESWYQLFPDRADYSINPDIPVMGAWKLIDDSSRLLQRMERNPYYWKVDTEGNQLPYIDYLAFVIVEDRDTVVLKAVAGETDLEVFNLNQNHFPLLIQESERNNFRLLRNEVGAMLGLNFIWHYPEQEVVEIMKQRDFRLAISLGFDRQQIIDLVEFGMTLPRQGVIHESNPAYREQHARQHTQYDPERANELLDSVGLDKRDANGWRLLPSGKRLDLVIGTMVNPAGFEPAQLIERDFKKLGLNAILKVQEYGPTFELAQQGAFPMVVAEINAAPLPTIRPSDHFPVGFSGGNPFGVYAQWFDSNGTDGVQPDDPGIHRLYEIYQEATGTLDEDRRNALITEAMQLHVDNLWQIGNTGWLTFPGIVKNFVHNVPDKMRFHSGLPHPRYTLPEQYFIRE